MASFTNAPSIHGFSFLASKCDVLYDAMVAALCHSGSVKKMPGW